MRRKYENPLLTKGGGRKYKVCSCVLEVIKPFRVSQRSEGGLALHRVPPDPTRKEEGSMHVTSWCCPVASLVSSDQAYSELGTPQTPVGVGGNHHSLLWGSGECFLLQDDSLWSDQRFSHAGTGPRSLTDVGWESWGPRSSPRVLEKGSWRHSWAAMWRTYRSGEKEELGVQCAVHTASKLTAYSCSPTASSNIKFTFE